MDRLQAVGVNAPQIEFWNGPAGEKWARGADGQDAMLTPLGIAAMDVCAIQPGDTVLDVGCGSGSTTLEIARRVGAGGRVLGVDISTPMLDVARTRLAALGVDGVTFDNKDVATYPFEAGTFDNVFSRFGVMFFIDPVAAFTNIRTGLKPGGQLGFVCWQGLDKNPRMAVPVNIALKYVTAPPSRGPEAPGPLSFADPDRVRRILSGAGFGDINMEALETMIRVGPDAPGSVQKLMESGQAGRLIGPASEAVKARIADDIVEALADYQTDDGVMMGGAVWIVTATA